MLPTDPNANEEDLFDLAAKLAGCQPVDLLKVRRDPAGLVVILATGQKFVFDPAALGEQLDRQISAQLAAVLGLDAPPAPDPVGAKQAPSASPAAAKKRSK